MGVPIAAMAAVLIALLVVSNGAGALTRVSPSTSAGAPVATIAQPATLAAQPTLVAPIEAGCNYTISLNGTIPIARGPSGEVAIDSTPPDVGAFLTSLFVSHETFCVTAGDYTVGTVIQIEHRQGVTLRLDPGAVMTTTSRLGTLLVYASPETVIEGGTWIGPGRGNTSELRIQYGSNGTVVEDADVSDAGRDGILIYDSGGPSFHVSILDNFLHDNDRYGVQEYSNATTPVVGTLISGNYAVDNHVGGIYTNGIGGVTISQNQVSNSVGDGPGEIGIGVTNGYNDTVSHNQVAHMAWFGIQAYYNNYTVISNNISTLNAGGEDQSGITNDHSSYDRVVGNVVESNGKYGVYVERSWDVTISGNIADDNYGYGIALYHGTITVMGGSSIVGNVCSFNSLGGIILNSAIDDVISMNQCDDNSGAGVLLYNDPGQAGSQSNVVSDNWLGNQGGSTPVQSYGIREANDSYYNVFVSNVCANDTVAGWSLVGPDAVG